MSCGIKVRQKSKKLINALKNLDLYILCNVNSRCWGPATLTRYFLENQSLLPKKHQVKPFKTLFKTIAYHYSKLKKMGLIKRIGWSWELEHDLDKKSLKFVSMCQLSFEAKKYVPHNRRLMFKLLNDDFKHFPENYQMKNWPFNKEIFQNDEMMAELCPATNVFGPGTKGIIIRLKKPSFFGIIQTEDDIDEVNALYDAEIIKCAKWLEEEFDMELEKINPKTILTDAELHDAVLDSVPGEWRYDDTISKKKYKNKIEFKSIASLKNYLRESNLQQTVPEIVEAMNRTAHVIEEVESFSINKSNQLEDAIINKLVPSIDRLAICINEHIGAVKDIRSSSQEQQKTTMEMRKGISDLIEAIKDLKEHITQAPKEDQHVIR
jgi:ribosome-associated toxin RatA of RatAB toxin-antitoxin module